MSSTGERWGGFLFLLSLNMPILLLPPTFLRLMKASMARASRGSISTSFYTFGLFLSRLAFASSTAASKKSGSSVAMMLTRYSRCNCRGLSTLTSGR